MVKVLVVEDEASIREMIALNLRLAGMEAVEADSAEAALPLLEQRPGCDAAILDVMLPGMNGFSLCETIRRTDQKIGIGSMKSVDPVADWSWIRPFTWPTKRLLSSLTNRRFQTSKENISA